MNLDTLLNRRLTWFANAILNLLGQVDLQHLPSRPVWKDWRLQFTELGSCILPFYSTQRRFAVKTTAHSTSKLQLKLDKSGQVWAQGDGPLICSKKMGHQPLWNSVPAQVVRPGVVNQLGLCPSYLLHLLKDPTQHLGRLSWPPIGFTMFQCHIKGY